MTSRIVQRLWRVKRAPRRIAVALRKQFRMREMRRRGICYLPPNVIFRDVIKPGDIIADAGCADDADFSRHMISQYGASAWGIDPTRKHAVALQKLSSELTSFRYLPVAVAATTGRLTFHESDVNVSGSLLNDHVNMISDTGQSYEVEALDLRALAERIGTDRIAILKLDLEGAEYELLAGIAADTLKPFDQIFIEFHHHAVARYDESDTADCVLRLVNLGFKSFSLDDHNYIFYRA